MPEKKYLKDLLKKEVSITGLENSMLRSVEEVEDFLAKVYGWTTPEERVIGLYKLDHGIEDLTPGPAPADSSFNCNAISRVWL